MGIIFHTPQQYGLDNDMTRVAKSALTFSRTYGDDDRYAWGGHRQVFQTFYIFQMMNLKKKEC